MAEGELNLSLEQELSDYMSEGARTVLPKIEAALKEVSPRSKKAKQFKQWKQLFSEWKEAEESGDPYAKMLTLREAYELCMITKFK